MIVDIMIATGLLVIGGMIVYLCKAIDHLHDAVENQSKMCGHISDKMTDIRIEQYDKLVEILDEIKEPPFDDGVELNKDSIEDLYTNDDGVYSRKAYLDKISIVHKK